MMYKQWNIQYYRSGSTVWHATRFGVRMSARTKSELFQMIDLRHSGEDNDYERKRNS